WYLLCWCCSCWCWRYGLDPRLRLSGRADATRAAAVTAAHRLRAQGQSPLAAPTRAAIVAALSRSHPAIAQGGCPGRQRIMAVSCSSLHRLCRNLGRGLFGADVPQWTAFFLVGRPDRADSVAWQRAVFSRAFWS